MDMAAIRQDESAGATRRLARFAAGLSYGDLDAATRHAAKRHILDTLGACLAGSAQPVTEAAEAVLAEGTAEGAVPTPRPPPIWVAPPATASSSTTATAPARYTRAAWWCRRRSPRLTNETRAGNRS